MKIMPVEGFPDQLVCTMYIMYGQSSFNSRGTFRMCTEHKDEIFLALAEKHKFPEKELPTILSLSSKSSN